MADPVLTAEPVATGGPALPAEVLERLPTPAYVYDLAEVRRNCAALRAALPERTALYYSLKANPHPTVLAALDRLGLRAEVCSPGELAGAVAAGFDPAEMLYTGPGKRDADLREALAAGVRLFSFDSPAGLDQLDRLAAERGTTVEGLLRVNDERPVRGQGLAMTGVPSQFGADTGWILAEPERFAGTERVAVVGLHLYMGTNVAAVDDLVAQFAHSLETAATLRDALLGHGVRLRVLDLGGGFAAPFAHAGGRLPLDGLRDRLSELLDRWAAGWRDAAPEVAFESGRYVVGTAGTLITRVLDAKRSHGQEVVVLESGINHLGGMSGLRRLPPLAPHLVTTGPAELSDLTTMVTGPLCTPLDNWNRAATLPQLRPGQLVAVPNVGAYGLYASLVAFLGHPLPAEVVVDLDATGPDGPVLDVSRLELTRTALPDRQATTRTETTRTEKES